MSKIRRAMAICAAGTLLIWCGKPPQALGQTPSAQNLFRQMSRSAEAMQRTLGKRSDEAAGLLEKVQTELAFLREIQAGAPPAKVWLLSLQSLAALLARLEKWDQRRAPNSKLVIEDEQGAISLLREVEADLALKVAQVKNMRGPAMQPVQVIVRTKRTVVEIAAYEVWYAPRGWASVADKHRRFDKLSSPTTQELAPGNYFLWTRRGKAETERVPVSVGGDGKLLREIDLLIP